MDTCVIPLRHGGLSLVQTTDYIYPIVDDPYMMVNTHFRVTLKMHHRLKIATLHLLTLFSPL